MNKTTISQVEIVETDATLSIGQSLKVRLVNGGWSLFSAYLAWGAAWYGVHRHAVWVAVIAGFVGVACVFGAYCALVLAGERCVIDRATGEVRRGKAVFPISEIAGVDVAALKPSFRPVFRLASGKTENVAALVVLPHEAEARRVASIVGSFLGLPDGRAAAPVGAGG